MPKYAVVGPLGPDCMDFGIIEAESALLAPDFLAFQRQPVGPHDVVWLPSQGRWIGRTSVHLPKRVRIAAAIARGAPIPLNCEEENAA